MNARCVVVALVVFASTACGALNPETLAFVEDERPGQTEIRLAIWPTPGIADAIDDWEREHPTATVVLDVSPFDDHHQDLLDPPLSAVEPDIVAFDAQYSANFRDRPDLFVNLDDFGAASLEAKSVPWAWEQGVATNGAIVGVPVDVGGLALAYRADLLAQNLTRAVETATTWCELIAAGDMYSDLTQRAFFAESADLFEAVLLQSQEQFHDESGELILEGSVGLAHAWDITMHALGERALFQERCPDNADVQQITRSIDVGGDQWREAIESSEITAVIAPLTMLDEIQSAAATSAGSWRVTSVPGIGGGNGSSLHLGIHSQTDHTSLAWDLIAHLSEPSNQLRTFRTSGRFPAAESTYMDADVRNTTEDFFGDSPIGRTYIENIRSSGNAPGGPEFRMVLREFRAAVRRVEQGIFAPDEAWTDALQRIDQLLD